MSNRCQALKKAPKKAWRLPLASRKPRSRGGIRQLHLTVKHQNRRYQEAGASLGTAPRMMDFSECVEDITQICTSRIKMNQVDKDFHLHRTGAGYLNLLLRVYSVSNAFHDTYLVRSYRSYI